MRVNRPRLGSGTIPNPGRGPMRTTRRSSPYENFSEAFRAFLKRRAAELCGLGLIGLAGVVTTALATWSVEDPSLNNATDATVRNLLGLPGAIVADLAMQLFGLASVLLLTPIAVWGWQLVRSRKVRRLHLRLALWIGGSRAADAGAGALPAARLRRCDRGRERAPGDRPLALADRARRRRRRRAPRRREDRARRLERRRLGLDRLRLRGRRHPRHH